MTGRSRRTFLRNAAQGGLAVSVGFAASGLASTNAAAQSGRIDADIGFCRDMSAHHVQAIVMCERVLGRDTGGAVQAAATEVLRNQSIEVGMMRAWLTDWGAPTTTPTMAMGWMGMNDGRGMPLAMMPGLATDAQLHALATANGSERGRLWLELMRAHHVGGVAMADAATNLGSSEKVLRLARQQVATQTFEIAQYDQLLATTYA